MLLYYKMPRSKHALALQAPAKTPDIQPPSFMQTLKEGFAFGTGSSIARNMIDRVMPPSRVCHEPCVTEMNEFENCLLAQDSEAFCGDKRILLRDCVKRNEMK